MKKYGKDAILRAYKTGDLTDAGFRGKMLHEMKKYPAVFEKEISNLLQMERLATGHA